MSLRLSISGARGIVGENLTPDVLLRIVSAFSDYLGDGAILIGRDSRPSGKSIEHFVGGILSMLGRDVYFAGILPTPTIALCTKSNGAAGGIAITASHNPEQWNALKLLDSDGLFLSAEFWKSIDLNTIFEHRWARYDEIGSIAEHDGCVFEHIKKVIELPYVDVGAIRKAKFRVAYDGVGGAGPAVMIPLLRELGAEIVPIGHKMDGEFIHSPEPIPENLIMLSELVREHGADIGIATDPDADRLAIVDENGVPIGEEMTLALATEQILSHTPGDVVVNLSTSTVIDWIAQKYNVEVHRTPVGEYWVSKKMLEIGAVVGGEGNGGVIVPQMHPVRDAATAISSILTLLAHKEKTVSEVCAEFPAKTMLKTKFPFDSNFNILGEKILKEFSPNRIDNNDGVWFQIPDGFVHIRASNTEPVVRVIVEASDEKTAENFVSRAKNIIKSD